MFFKSKESKSQSDQRALADDQPNEERHYSLFEFGPKVDINGEILRGNCVGENPDAIQACIWSLETVEKQQADKTHRYKIEF
mmetsp:Transcript_12517/g.22402  ORF Transcript_12517/g.22402 Transcript_12517/m.22402 type:complete len:82 (+) Transcript_12517:210-455(+)|eukprot:CAMPEP_0175064060 /NCGR_PEP_ID=MMETSP0052_2-20121109/15112_1 /TAXON_ID=51329 ORGANISM="Polytomella parva, Strain SAG 63-3" /NCGR_SAMPLE_ID=MMETSP0052_2 /ASSEMBLY_ACC=CAM_ASM_000194 /LENGTH=81 /DNA_ID=CAMNT_0016330347 /DNA_START=139 /DNA_END=384 /DNA_ORIENTATION=-